VIGWLAIAVGADPRDACKNGDVAVCDGLLGQLGAEVAQELPPRRSSVRLEELRALAVQRFCPGCEPDETPRNPRWTPGGWWPTASVADGERGSWALYAPPGMAMAGPYLIVDPEGAARWAPGSWCQATLTDTLPPGVVGFDGPRCDTLLRISADGGELERRPRGAAIEAHADATTTWIRVPGDRVVRADDPSGAGIDIPARADFTGVEDGLPRFTIDRPHASSADLVRPRTLPPPTGPREVWVLTSPHASVTVTTPGPTIHREFVPSPFGGVVVGPPGSSLGGLPEVPVRIAEAQANDEGFAYFPDLAERARVGRIPIPDGPGTWVVRAESPPERVRIRVVDADGGKVAQARVWSEFETVTTARNGMVELDCKAHASAAHGDQLGSAPCRSGELRLSHPRPRCQAGEQTFPCDEVASRLAVPRLYEMARGGLHHLVEFVEVPGLDDVLQGADARQIVRVGDQTLLPRGPLPPEGFALDSPQILAEPLCLRGVVEPGASHVEVGPCMQVLPLRVTDAAGRPAQVTLRTRSGLSATSAPDGTVALRPEYGWTWNGFALGYVGRRLILPFGGPVPDDGRSSWDMATRLPGVWKQGTTPLVELRADGTGTGSHGEVRVLGTWPGGALVDTAGALSVWAFLSPDSAVSAEADGSWVVLTR
jgi:hypothetical protein